MPIKFTSVPAADYGWSAWPKIAAAVVLGGGLAALALVTFIVLLPVLAGMALVQSGHRL